MQEDSLLPESIVLERLTSEDIGITTYNTYKLKGAIDFEKVKSFPKYDMGDRGWTITTWHKPNDMEIRNLRAFLKTSNNESAIYWIQKNLLFNDEEILIAYATDKDDPDLKNEDFNDQNWIDIYFLKLSKNSLFHLSYGKF